MAHLVDAEHRPVHLAQAIVLDAGDIGMGNHGMDAWQGLGGAGIDTQNARMGMRAAENRSTQLTRLNAVAQKARVAAELGPGIGPDRQSLQARLADVMRGVEFHDGSGQQPAMSGNQAAGNPGQIGRQALLAGGAYIAEGGTDLQAPAHSSAAFPWLAGGARLCPGCRRNAVQVQALLCIAPAQGHAQARGENAAR